MIKPFSPTHIEEFGPLMDEFAQDESLWDRILLAYNDPSNVMFSVFAPNGKALAVLGGSFIYAQVMHVWTVLTLEVSKFPITYHKAIKRLVHDFTKRFNIKRVQLTVRADNPKALRQNRIMGFEVESRMENYGPDCSTYLMLARCF